MFCELILLFHLKWRNLVNPKWRNLFYLNWRILVVFFYHCGICVLIYQLFLLQMMPMLVLDFLILFIIEILATKVLIVTIIENLKFFITHKILFTFVFCESVWAGVADSDKYLLAAEFWKLHCFSQDASFSFVQLSGALFVAGFGFRVHGY